MTMQGEAKAMQASRQLDELLAEDPRIPAGPPTCGVVHDLSLAAAHAYRLAVMDAGRLAAVGPPGEVFSFDLLSAASGCLLVLAADGPR